MIIELRTNLQLTIDFVKANSNWHLTYGNLCMQEGGAVYLETLYLLGLISRSWQISEVFIESIESRRYYMSASSLRMQIDSFLRSRLWRYVPDFRKACELISAGEKISKLKDKYGNKLSDAHLVDLCSDGTPWLRTVYKATSGSIHFSDKHIFGQFHGYEPEQRSSIVRLSCSQDHLPSSSFEELCFAFLEISQRIRHEIELIARGLILIRLG